MTVSSNPKRGGFDIREDNRQYGRTETRQNGFLEYCDSHKYRLLTNYVVLSTLKPNCLRVTLAEAVDSEIVERLRDLTDATLQRVVVLDQCLFDFVVLTREDLARRQSRIK